MSNHWLSAKLGTRHGGTDGDGVFARQPITAGERLVTWGGVVMREDELADAPPLVRVHAIQVESDLFLAPLLPLEPADFFNHSCQPNAGVRGQLSLVALREIAAGEEVCFDYAMTDSLPYDEFECGCRTPLCRGRVTARDWQRSDLQARYGRHFSTYLLERMRDRRAQTREAR